MSSTQTSRSILGNEEAVLLAFMIQDMCEHPVHLAQVIFSTATPLLCDELEVFVATVNHLRSHEMTDAEVKIHEYIKNTIRSMRGRSVIHDRYAIMAGHQAVRRPDRIRQTTRPHLIDTANSRTPRILELHGEQLNRVRKVKSEG